LRPATLDDIGLAPALTSLVERMRTLHGLEVQSEIDLAHTNGRHPTRLVPETESTVYRIVQEALTNVAKHAGATHVWVSAAESAGRIRVVVRDDGVGFDPGASHGRFGLVGMRERVALIGGTLAIQSAPDEGTTVTIELPAEHRRADEQPAMRIA
jgi:signal transduction histidine kinase